MIASWSLSKSSSSLSTSLSSSSEDDEEEDEEEGEGGRKCFFVRTMVKLFWPPLFRRNPTCSRRIMFSQQLEVEVRGWQVMLEKTVSLIKKLRFILLMDGDKNAYNRMLVGYKAIRDLEEINYIPEDQYSQ